MHIGKLIYNLMMILVNFMLLSKDIFLVSLGILSDAPDMHLVVHLVLRRGLEMLYSMCHRIPCIFLEHLQYCEFFCYTFCLLSDAG